MKTRKMKNPRIMLSPPIPLKITCWKMMMVRTFISFFSVGKVKKFQLEENFDD
jgi:hypothetical protein